MVIILRHLLFSLFKEKSNKLHKKNFLKKPRFNRV